MVALKISAVKLAFVELILFVFVVTLASSAFSAAVALLTSAVNNALKLPLEFEIASEMSPATVVPNKAILFARTVESALDFPASTVESVTNLFTNNDESLVDFTSATVILFASVVESVLDFPASTVESLTNLFTNKVESLVDFERIFIPFTNKLPSTEMVPLANTESFT